MSNEREHDSPKRNAPRATSSAMRTESGVRWERERAMGRTRFILRRGVFTLGVPMAVLTILYKVVQEQGFVASPRLTETLRTAIIIAFVIFPLCGWLFGRRLWQVGEEALPDANPETR